MNPESILAGTASLFLALGDKTRLRLLNLMRDREVCVSSFTGILEQSQPLVSRHLAYLRTSGIVEARRDGKWMHYSVSAQLDENSGRLLSELFKWMESQEGLRADREKYRTLMGELIPQPKVSKTPRQKAPTRDASRSTARRKPELQPLLIAEPEEIFENRVEEIEIETYRQPEPETYEDEESYTVVHHNELEDFLL
jgi:DNA-binding transcriptional ArsR family regulator